MRPVSHFIFVGTILAAIIVGILLSTLIDSGPSIYQSDKEVVAIMENAGYSNIKFGMAVKMMPNGVFGPCKLFTAKNYASSDVSGAYCTPKFMEWGFHITNREEVN